MIARYFNGSLSIGRVNVIIPFLHLDKSAVKFYQKTITRIMTEFLKIHNHAFRKIILH